MWRSGLTVLFVALNTAIGGVIGRIHRRHRVVEFKRFLARIDEEVPTDLDVHLVCDNASTHKTPAIQRWLAARPRFHVRFTPTSSSWLNQVERWFALLMEEQVRRGVHKNVQTLEEGVRTWVKTWNDDPKPFIWTKTADEILERFAGYLNRINDSDTRGCPGKILPQRRRSL